MSANVGRLRSHTGTPGFSLGPPYCPEVQATSGSDLLIAAFRLLTAAEQDDVLRELRQLQLERRAGDESTTGRMLRSLLTAAEHCSEPLTTTSYRRAIAELRSQGQKIESLNAVISHFGSWREAREAIELSADHSPRLIEARFARRRLDKVWRYNEKTLRETMQRCVSDLGHVPQVAEFEHWRQRELELARARGDDAAHLPSAGPYRRRWGRWEDALLALGFTSDRVVERLEQ